MKKEIMKLRIIAKVAEPDGQIIHYQFIEDVLAQQQANTENLVAYKTSELELE